MTKKKIIFIFVFIVSFFTFYKNVSADYLATFYSDNKCALTKGATGNCFYKNTSFTSAGPIWLDTGDMITVHTNVTPIPAPTKGNGSECKTTFSYVSNTYKNKTYNGYVCTANIRRIDSTDGISEEIKTEFKNNKLPESYWAKLAILKEKHPNWTFVGIDTGLDFNTAVSKEDSGKKSLIQSTSTASQGYLSTKETNYNWKTNKFTAYDGSTWFAANKETIAYYMDPRNFFSEMYIFQFELLSYDPNIHTLEGVKEVLGNSYISKFAELFIKAGEQEKVNPIYLASLSRQEVGGGTTAGRAVSGKAFTYNGVTYNHAVYNFYNIGATSGSDGLSAIRGLVYANGGENKSGGYGSNTSYKLPWTTEEKAIIGGAAWISKGYISRGQDTSYFKKWDVQSIKRDGSKYTDLYSHQYMQNIMAPYSEAITSFNSYYDRKALDSNFTFYIPVYSHMPESTSLPPQGNPNNYLSTLQYNDGTGNKNVNNFSGDVTSYEFHVANGVTNVTFTAKAIASTSKVAISGGTNLVVGDNTATIKVTAGNGSVKNYTIKIIRDEALGDIKPLKQIIEESKFNIDGEYLTGLTLTTSVDNIKAVINKVESRASVTIKRSDKEITSGNVVTGDILTISNGNESINYTVVLYGDTNSDGKINALDLLRVQKHILGTNKLTGVYYKAADVSKDGNINALDLLKVQKHILGSAFIVQQ